MKEDKEYQAWEKEVKRLQITNATKLASFKKWLESKGLKAKTVKNHILNVDCYADDYLLRYEPIPVEQGALHIDEFLGDFFVRKMSWSSKTAIRENIASFKKFYTFLNEKGEISDEELKEMKELIKEEKEEWFDNATW